MKYLTLLVFLGISLLCEAQQDSIVPFEKAYKRTYNIRKVSGVKPTIDGKLDEDFWTKQGEWSDRFVQIIPYERAITQSPTRVKLFYDDKYIYVGVYCKDAVPDKMNRFIGNRDDNSLGDLISVAFDTYHDYRAAPEFNINLGGNKTDLVVTDKLNVNLSWNAVWEGRTNINRADSSWTAELRIPFSQLRYNQRSEDGVWGLHVRRIIRRNNEVQNWSMIPLKNNGHVFSFGNMSGMDSVPKPRGIEFLPYVMGKYRQEPRIDGSPYQKGHSWGGNVGLDAKFALSDYTLDMTINPDYGQVELDPSVMNLTAYETFYDEKRPFFLEGKHILDFANGSDMMFYTRRIGASPSYTPRGIDNVGSYAETKENVPIIGALKLTGTNKRGLTIGVIESVTARSSSKVTRNGVEDVEVVEPLTNYTVARVQKNWKGNTLLGGSSSSLAPYYYVMGHMDQKTYGLTLKLQVNVTPDISIQFYGAPFTSIAKYDDFKLAADTKSHTFENRFQRIDPDQLTYADGVYTIGEGAGQMPFRNPDFRFNEFRSNLVARWEYLPGSTLYFVWEHRMSNRDNWYSSGWGSNLDRMWGLPATNTFMIKMNYWFNL